MTREEAWRRTKGYLYDVLSGEEADKIIRALEPKTGHWIEKMDACECLYCHKAWDYCDNDTEDFDYCPKCGAKLSEEPTSSKPEISSYYGLKSYVRERSE